MSKKKPSKKHSARAKKAWRTMRSPKYKQSKAAKKAWATRRANNAPEALAERYSRYLRPGSGKGSGLKRFNKNMKTKAQKKFEERVKKQKAFTNKLSLMRLEALELGLLKTRAKLEVAVTQVGWEIAEQIEKECG